MLCGKICNRNKKINGYVVSFNTKSKRLKLKLDKPSNRGLND